MWRPGSDLAHLGSRRVSLAVAVVASCAVAGAGAAPPEFVAITLAGGRATAVNDHGQVAGYFTRGDGGRGAFSWTEAGGLVDLGTLGGNSTEPTAISDEGQVVGNSAPAVGAAWHAFSWTQAGGMVDLGTLGGGTFSEARAVNGSGQVVGIARDASGVSHGFLWTESAGMVDLGSLGGNGSSANDINEKGQVVGASPTASGVVHAFLWSASTGMVDLGSLGGSGFNSAALSVNDSGWVVGESAGPSFSSHAFLWTEKGGMVDILGDRASSSEPKKVSNSGQVVGIATGTDVRAFSWTPAAGVVDIGVIPETETITVNDLGQVVGARAGPLPANCPGRCFADSIAYSWTETGGVVDLGTGDAGAYAVDDNGDVVGSAGGRAMLWRPVPTGNAGPVTPAEGVATAPSVTETPGSPAVAVPTPAPPTTAPPAATMSPTTAEAAPKPRPLIGKPTAAETIRAGHAATILFAIVRSDNRRPFLAGTPIARTSIAGRSVVHRIGLARGVASVRLTVPPSAKGKLLSIRLTIQGAGGSATRLSTFRIR